jgi:hypothetical protein
MTRASLTLLRTRVRETGLPVSVRRVSVRLRRARSTQGALEYRPEADPGRFGASLRRSPSRRAEAPAGVALGRRRERSRRVSPRSERSLRLRSQRSAISSWSRPHLIDACDGAKPESDPGGGGLAEGTARRRDGLCLAPTRPTRRRPCGRADSPMTPSRDTRSCARQSAGWRPVVQLRRLIRET